MKTLILKRHSVPYNKPDGGLKDEGVNNARLFAHKIGYLFEGASIGIFCSDQERTRHTADVVVQELGLQADVAELDSLREFSFEKVHFLQGLGQHLPSDVDVALCVSHAPTLGGLNRDLDMLPIGVSLELFEDLIDDSASIYEFPSNDWLDLSKH